MKALVLMIIIYVLIITKVLKLMNKEDLLYYSVIQVHKENYVLIKLKKIIVLKNALRAFYAFCHSHSTLNRTRDLSVFPEGR